VLEREAKRLLGSDTLDRMAAVELKREGVIAYREASPEADECRDGIAPDLVGYGDSSLHV